mmetsp:Transcript_40506/g.49315  ORF Transcript_40506/g.49315 Transcript_40506/m.49315 type:complete len:341 (+) Transcript_40506:3-1025(+)
MTYMDVKERQKSVGKDEILRVSMFDATKMIVEGAKNNLYKRYDAYFTDYSLMGLNVHQNYLKVMTSQLQRTKQNGDFEAELEVIERMHEATHTMSDFALAEHAVRSGDQNWGLLPTCATLVVKTGSHAGGPTGSFFPSYPEFAGWLGKNSTRGKTKRLLSELKHHMNYKISTDSTDLRLLYLPMLREKFIRMMYKEEEGVEMADVIELMDQYGIDRDDLFDNIDEFTLNDKARKLANLDSKAKAAFTREYNRGAHMSQALVAKHAGALSKKKKGAAGNGSEAKELDVVDDDAPAEEEEDEQDDEDDPAEIEKMFKKGKSKAKNGAKKKTGAAAGGKRKRK